MNYLDSLKSFFSGEHNSADIIDIEENNTVKLGYIDQFLTNDIKMRKTEVRNILLFGSSQSGKTTFKNMLLNSKTVAGRWSIFAKTKIPTVDTYSVEYNNKNFVINLIDTPGLYERVDTRLNEKERQVADLQEIIMDCVESSITTIDFVFFFFPRHDILDMRTIEAIKHLINEFPTLKDKSYLIINRCEKINQTNRTSKQWGSLDKYLDDFKIYDILWYYISKKRYFLSGCIDRDDYDNEFKDMIISQVKNIIYMKEQIMKLILSDSKPFKISAMKQGQAMIDTMALRIKEFEIDYKNLVEKFKQNKSLNTYIDYDLLLAKTNGMLKNPLSYQFLDLHEQKIKNLVNLEIKFDKQIVDEFKQKYKSETKVAIFNESINIGLKTPEKINEENIDLIIKKDNILIDKKRKVDDFDDSEEENTNDENIIKDKIHVTDYYRDRPKRNKKK